MPTNQNIFFSHSVSAYSELSSALKKYAKWMLVVDEGTENNCREKFTKNVGLVPTHTYVIPEGESSKNLEQLDKIWSYMLEHGFDKSSAIVNLGGGMVTDLGGFVASTFKRGIDVYNVPTSLLSMVDAAIGGKNGINFQGAKNQIGNIHFPKMVVVDADYLESLPENELRSGYAEVIKHALIGDLDLWNDLKNIDKIESISNWSVIVERAVKVKVKIAERDPFEKGERKLLNYGHTVGHALEAVYAESNNPISHGDSVALGMIIENELALQKQLINDDLVKEIRGFILNHFPVPVWSERNMTFFQKMIQFDKKNQDGKLNFSLISDIGKGLIDQYFESDEVKSVVKNFFNEH